MSDEMRLRLHRYAHERSFRSGEDFARYADEQRAKFTSLQKSSTQDFQWWASAASTGWASAAASAKPEGATEQSIQNTLNSHPVFPYESQLTRVLMDMTRLGRNQAAQEIGPFLKGANDGNNARSLTVMQLDAHAAFITALGLESSSRSGQGRASFAALLNEHEERLGGMLDADRKEMAEKRAQFDELISGSSGRFEELASGAAARFEQLESRLAQEMESWKGQWLETHNAFIEQLATETAVDLWSRRSTAHEGRYKTFRKWAIGFGLAGLVVSIVWIFAGFAFARWVFPNDNTAQLASYTAGSLALFTLFIWGLRVLIRSMMSEDHLSIDASARSALAHTYLALTKEQAATPEDRAIILASLFAPVSDGLVKDDGLPALSPTAMAAQILTNPSR